jgi:hypothetical protein
MGNEQGLIMGWSIEDDWPGITWMAWIGNPSRGYFQIVDFWASVFIRPICGSRVSQ